MVPLNLESGFGSFTQQLSAFHGSLGLWFVIFQIWVDILFRVVQLSCTQHYLAHWKHHILYFCMNTEAEKVV